MTTPTYNKNKPSTFCKILVHDGFSTAIAYSHVASRFVRHFPTVTGASETNSFHFFFEVLFWRDRSRLSVACMPPGAAGREERSVHPMFAEDECADFFADLAASEHGSPDTDDNNAHSEEE